MAEYFGGVDSVCHFYWIGPHVGRPLLTFAALVISIVWLSLQFRQWYIPYLFGKGNTDWFIEHGYDATMKILPAISGRVVTPDLQHNILQLLSAVVIFTAVKAFLQSRRNVPRCGNRNPWR